DSGGTGVEIVGTRAFNNTTPIVIHDVAVHDFQTGIAVAKDGYLSVLSGVEVSSNGYGLQVTDGFVRVRASPGEPVTSFDNNSTAGMDVEGDQAVVDLAGGSLSRFERSLSVSYNGGPGILMRAPAGHDDGLGLSNEIVGVAFKVNGEGMRLLGG